jgi:hypothetical protein
MKGSRGGAEIVPAVSGRLPDKPAELWEKRNRSNLREVGSAALSIVLRESARLTLWRRAAWDGMRTLRGANMSAGSVELDHLVLSVVEAVKTGEGRESGPETTMQQRFYELIVLIMGNLYTKTPVAGPLFDRNTLVRITAGMDDTEAGKLAQRGEDWLRLEGLLRQQDGAKAYFVTRPSLAVMSTITSHGSLGEIFDKILKRYQDAMPSDALRDATRMLGSYFLTRVARS